MMHRTTRRLHLWRLDIANRCLDWHPGRNQSALGQQLVSCSGSSAVLKWKQVETFISSLVLPVSDLDGHARRLFRDWGGGREKEEDHGGTGRVVFHQ